MTDDEFSAMVLEAFKLQPTGGFHYPLAPNQLRHLVNRAVEAERERMTVNSIHTCHPECDRPGCVAVRKAVEAEREAICPIVYGLCISDNNAQEIVEAIRARGGGAV